MSLPTQLGNEPLALAELVSLARTPDARISLAHGVETRVTGNAAAAVRSAEASRLYGRNTGVGANRHVSADDSDGQHGRRLLRSHAAGSGPTLPEDTGRALLVVRANQLAGGRSGIVPDILRAVLTAFNDGLSPVVRTHGGLGTGDITVLAELGLSMLGERPWSNGETRAVLDDIDASGGLPLMSSSAPTLAVAALALADVRSWVNALFATGALAARAVRANPEAWSEVGSSSRAHPGMIEAGQRMRALSGSPIEPPGRLQDPFAWRCLVSVNGALLDSLSRAEETLTVDINASAENPLYANDASWHHGGFHHAGLALALDQLRLALVQAASLSLSRLTKVNDPAMTGLRPFLAEGPAGSSGTMVLEYTAASAMADLRQWAQPASLAQTVISLGLEDHASFAWQSAIATRASLTALRTILACELVAAARAVRQLGLPPDGHPLARLLAQCDSLPDIAEDHALIEDLAAATALLSTLQ